MNLYFNSIDIHRRAISDEVRFAVSHSIAYHPKMGRCEEEVILRQSTRMDNLLRQSGIRAKIRPQVGMLF
ncbi:MAG: hypothetical protein WCU80_05365 [Paludibacteraceae bacterium]|nr:hypothetical protein [Prevotellaceae bacterium]